MINSRDLLIRHQYYLTCVSCLWQPAITDDQCSRSFANEIFLSSRRNCRGGVLAFVECIMWRGPWWDINECQTTCSCKQGLYIVSTCQEKSNWFSLLCVHIQLWTSNCLCVFLKILMLTHNTAVCGHKPLWTMHMCATHMCTHTPLWIRL